VISLIQSIVIVLKY